MSLLLNPLDKFTLNPHFQDFEANSFSFYKISSHLSVQFMNIAIAYVNNSYNFNVSVVKSIR